MTQHTTLGTNPSTEALDHEDIIASFASILGQDFTPGTPLATVVALANKRVTELRGPADQEAEFDESSLELGMLKGLLAMLPEAVQGAPAGAVFH